MIKMKTKYCKKNDCNPGQKGLYYLLKKMEWLYPSLDDYRATGIYFSEELKVVEAQGYKIKLIEGYEFSQKCLFNTYIQHFFEIKK